MTSDVVGYTYEGVRGAESTTMKAGWIYHLVARETGTGRMLSLSKIGQTAAGNLHDRMHTAKQMSSYSTPYVHWALVDLRPVDDIDRAEALIVRALDWRGMRLGKRKKHASEQFYMDGRVREYLAQLFLNVPWTTQPWSEPCVGSRGGTTSPTDELVVLRCGRYPTDPGDHLKRDGEGVIAAAILAVHN